MTVIITASGTQNRHSTTIHSACPYWLHDSTLDQFH